jgi:hypothetical protein
MFKNPFDDSMREFSSKLSLDAAEISKSIASLSQQSVLEAARVTAQAIADSAKVAAQATTDYQAGLVAQLMPALTSALGGYVMRTGFTSALEDAVMCTGFDAFQLLFEVDMPEIGIAPLAPSSPSSMEAQEENRACEFVQRLIQEYAEAIADGNRATIVCQPPEVDRFAVWRFKIMGRLVTAQGVEPHERHTRPYDQIDVYVLVELSDDGNDSTKDGELIN